jgi:hypothetical protein
VKVIQKEVREDLSAKERSVRSTNERSMCSANKRPEHHACLETGAFTHAIAVEILERLPFIGFCREHGNKLTQGRLDYD